VFFYLCLLCSLEKRPARRKSLAAPHSGLLMCIDACLWRHLSPNKLHDLLLGLTGLNLATSHRMHVHQACYCFSCSSDNAAVLLLSCSCRCWCCGGPVVPVGGIRDHPAAQAEGLTAYAQVALPSVVRGAHPLLPVSTGTVGLARSQHVVEADVPLLAAWFCLRSTSVHTCPVSFSAAACL
jgi:hypothetical protein